MKIKQTTKRRVALFLGVLMAFQTAFFVGPTGAAEDGGRSSYDISEKGQPTGIFSTLEIAFNNKVIAGNQFGFRVDGIVDEEVSQSIFKDFTDGVGMDSAEWEEAGNAPAGYNAYLDGISDAELPEIGFSLNFDFPEGMLKSGEDFHGEMKTLEGLPVGSLELAVSGKEATLTGKVYKHMYNYTDVTLGGSIDAELEFTYEKDAEITVTPGEGSNDFDIKIPDDKIENIENTDYEITKEAKLQADKRTIVYEVHASLKASNFLLLDGFVGEDSEEIASDGDLSDSDDSGDAASDSEMREPASKAETRKAKKLRKAREKKAALAASSAEAADRDRDEEADRTYDPEDDEDWEDEDTISRGPGLFTALIDKMVPKQYGRIASDGELPEISDIRGKKIVDKIPTDLEVIKVEKENEGTYEELTKADSEDGLDGSSYSLDENGVLTYMIPADGEELLNSFNLRITTRVSDDKYNSYMLSEKPEGEEWEFSNKAFLRGKDDETLAASKSAKTKITLPAPYQKDGYVIAGSGGKIEWKLDVTSYFSNDGVTLWAIDHISDVENTHYYIPEDGIQVNGEPRDIAEYGKGEEPLNGDYAYSKITYVTDINEILSDLKSNGLTSQDKDAILYRYDAADGRVDAVMLIPLSADKNKNIEITYQTQANIEMKPGDDGTDGIKRDLTNDAKITWTWLAGGGPGGSDSNKEFGTVGIYKTFPVIFSLIKKTAESNAYNAKKNEITWTFEVNQMGVDASHIKIEDVLIKGTLSLVSPGTTGSDKLILKPVGAGALRELYYVEPDSLSADETSWLGDFYTVKTDGDGNQRLIVFLEKLKGEEHYTFQITTFVDDLGGTVGNNQKKTITNNCSINAMVGPNSLEFNTSASSDIVNTLIKKESIQSDGEWYNYKDNTVKWRVTINPNQWKIQGAVITDALPPGTHFADLTAASSNTGSGSAMNIAYVPADDADTSVPHWTETAPPRGTWRATTSDGNTVINVKQNAAGEALIFTFPEAEGAEISTPYTFEFTTHVEESKRKEFSSNRKNSLHNDATLTGDIIFDNGKHFVAVATGGADNPYCPAPMVKSGQYVKLKKITIDNVEREIYAVDWELYVNRTKADLSGGIVTDEIQECMELLPDTMKVSTVNLDASGKPTGDPVQIFPAQPASGKGDFTTLNEQEFVYKIPAVYGKDTLKFEFTTMLVDDAQASDMTNNVTLFHGNSSDSTGDVKAKDADSFHLGLYATAKGVCMTKIYKTSANKTGKYPLQGATFAIYKMVPPQNMEDRDNIELWEKENEATKIQTSNNRGSLSFMFLKPDTMYKIVETSPPAGYQPVAEDDFSWYVVPEVTKGKTEVYPENPDQTAEDASYSVFVNTPGISYHVLNIENEPIGLSEGGKLQFRKKGQGGQNLAGVEFVARYGSDTSGVGETVKSNANGLVSFENLDVLPADKVYTIKERIPAGYKDTAWFIEAKVYLDANQKPVAEFVNSDGKLEMVDNEKILNNQPITQSGSFSKVDQNGVPVLGKKVTFKVKRRGDGGQLLGQNSDGTIQLCIDVDGDGRMKTQGSDGLLHSADQYYDYLPLENSILASDMKGAVSFDSLPYGDYQLTEQSDLADIQLPGEGANAKIIYIRINKSGAFASNMAFSKADLATGTAGTRLSATDAGKFLVMNQLQYADLQINKVLGKRSGDKLIPATAGDGKTIPLEGIKFNIYRDETGNGILNPGQSAFIADLVTDGSGHLTFPANAKKLTVGKYLLKETDSKGYASVSQAIPFTVSAKRASTGATFTPDIIYIGWDGQNYSVKQASGPSGGASILFLNESKGGKVIGHKSAKDASGSFDLINAEFELKPVAPTVSGYMTAKSNSKGEFVFENVPLGTYELSELRTPDDGHYRKDDRVATVTVSSADEVIKTGVINGSANQPLEFVNEAFSTLTIQKLAQVVTGNTAESLAGEMRPGEGFIFKITGSSFEGETIQSFLTSADVDGDAALSIGADGVYVTTGASGTVSVKNLPAGNYKVLEQLNEKNDERGIYVPDTQEKSADILISHDTGKVSTPVITVENQLKRGQIQGLKTAGDKTTPLSDAVIGLFPAGTTSFVEANLWCGQKATSNGEGKYLFQNIPYGTYIVAELLAPAGYNLNTTTRYEVTVASEPVKTTGFLIEGSAPKAETETPVTIANTKKSSGGGGGGGGGGETKPADPTAPGPGSESTAPNPGESIPGETLPTIPVETEPGGGTVVIPPNTPPGSDFEVKDPGGNTVFEGKTDENGQIHLDLPPGEYTLVTLDDNDVPLASMNFTIEDSDVPLAQLAAPDAGDHSVPVVLLGVMMLISLLGIIVISGRKKKDGSHSEEEK